MNIKTKHYKGKLMNNTREVPGLIPRFIPRFILRPMLSLFLSPLLGAAVCLTLTPTLQAEGIETADGEQGKALYLRECAACHGVDGDGEGPGAYILSQRPRNLQLGVFKLRSSKTGEYPSNEDIFKTISNGISGAGGAMMPSFASLSEQERWSLVEHVKTLAEIDAPGEAMAIPPQPKKADLALGKDIYQRLECNDCHGSEGHGDGSSALTLEDDQKRRIWAPDLTLGRYKGGGEPADIYQRIITGMDGSPMPSYAGKATDDELWALTMYVLSLSPNQN